MIRSNAHVPRMSKSRSSLPDLQEMSRTDDIMRRRTEWNANGNFDIMMLFYLNQGKRVLVFESKYTDNLEK